jgi:hypothetical protein
MIYKLNKFLVQNMPKFNQRIKSLDYSTLIKITIVKSFSLHASGLIQVQIPLKAYLDVGLISH